MDLCEYNLVYDFSNIDNGIVYIVSPLYSVVPHLWVHQPLMGNIQGKTILESPQKQNCSLLQASRYSHNITWVRSLGWEDPLEKRKATHSSILA